MRFIEYVKIKRKGQKYYQALYQDKVHLRLSLKIHRKATDAIQWGKRAELRCRVWYKLVKARRVLLDSATLWEEWEEGRDKFGSGVSEEFFDTTELTDNVTTTLKDIEPQLRAEAQLERAGQRRRLALHRRPKSDLPYITKEE